MQTVFNDNVALNVRVDGPEDGRQILFSNSLGTDLRVWDFLLGELPKDLRIIRYDKRGHGLSDCPPAPYSMDALVSDAEKICTELQLREVTFVGLSIGGLIGQGLAARRPDFFKALVLMDTGAKIGTQEMWQTRIDALRAGGISSISETILDRWFSGGFRHSNAVRPWQHMLNRTPLEGYIGCSEAIAASDFSESTKGLTVPTLALVGAEDGATTPDLMRATAQLCNADFHIIEEAGHLPCVEQPEATAALINDFLERTAS